MTIEEDMESMAQILNEAGLHITGDKLKQITTDYNLHIEMKEEMSSNQFIDRNPQCSKCQSLKKEIENYEHREIIWSDSVKNKIQGATYVYMGSDNKIKYDLRKR